MATTLGGIALGEVTHRMSSLVLDDSKRGFSRFTREFLGTLICPMRGLNRMITGEMWKVKRSHYKYHDYDRIPVHFSIGVGDRYLADDNYLFRGEHNPYLEFRVQYGDAFDKVNDGSHPGSNDLDATVVYGVNQDQLRAEHRIVSNASCTTNCIIPVIKLLDDAYGIESGTVTTIHSAMHDQQVIDAYHPDLRRTRAASQSIIPVDTKLAAGITRFFPQFNDRFEAIAVRVPTINVTAIDLSVTVKKPVKANEVNLLLQKAAQGAFHGIVDYTELPLVSVDFNHDPHSAIVDGTQTRVSGAHLIKTLVWCDNEWGFANRMLDTTLAMATVAFR